MILAEKVPQEMCGLGKRCNCPAKGVTSVMRVTWTGGITKRGGAEIDDQEKQLYRIAVRKPGGDLATMTPIVVADLNDNDNNQELCFDLERQPLNFFFPADSLTDPNGDLNPAREVKVQASRRYIRGLDTPQADNNDRCP
ncbi:MAG: hypothetical protein HC850_00455 [Rhodomicrobium sp.]|nr:hypothetical protein [Rhodomicrobium sp.]